MPSITTTTFPDTSCNNKCPGNPAENCGGDILLIKKHISTTKRDILGAIVVSLYKQIVPPPAIVYTTNISSTSLNPLLFPPSQKLPPTASD